MNLARILGQAAGVAGQAVEGYGIDKHRRVTDVLNQRKLANDERRDLVLNALAQAQTRKLNEPVVRARPQTVSPGEGVWNEEKQAYEVPVAAPPPAAPSLTFQTLGGVDGQPPKIVALNPKTGEKVREIGDAKPTGSAAKLTEPQEKSYLFYNLMEKSQPQIDTAMKSGNVRKLAVSAYLNAPGMAQPAANALLNADEQSLIRSFRDFAAGVLRKESGAAVTHDELREVWGRYGPGFGDDPRLDTEKSQARIDYMNTMKQQALPAIEFYGRKQGAAGSPAGKALTPEQYQRARAHYSDDEIRAQGYAIP